MGITKKTNTTGRTPMTTEGILAKNERRKAELLAKMDKDRANVINEDLFSHVSDFLDRALAGKCSADRSEAERRSVITKMR